MIQMQAASRGLPFTEFIMVPTRVITANTFKQSKSSSSFFGKSWSAASRAPPRKKNSDATKQ